MMGLRSVVHKDLWAAIDRRAMVLWPSLEHGALQRCRHDPARIAALVARRTRLPVLHVHRLLTMPAVSDEEATTWFG